MLNLLIFIPLFAALAIVLGAPARKSALLAGAANFLTSLVALVSYDKAKGGFQHVYSAAIAPEWDLKYLLGADGLSLMMLFLTGIVTLAAIWVTPPIEKRENLFYACVLLIAAGAAGAFASQDLFFFYAFHELALIPTFLLIGVWGEGERHTAAWKITIYLALGSFVLLIGLIDLYNALPVQVRTFDMIKLQQLHCGKWHSGVCAVSTVPLSSHWLWYSHLAISISFLGAASLCLRPNAAGHAARRRIEKVRTLRPHPARDTAVACRRAKLDMAAPRPPGG